MAPLSRRISRAVSETCYVVQLCALDAGEVRLPNERSARQAWTPHRAGTEGTVLPCSSGAKWHCLQAKSPFTRRESDRSSRAFSSDSAAEKALAPPQASRKSPLPTVTQNDPGGSRTRDLRIKSPLLYQLSYRVCPQNSRRVASRHLGCGRWRKGTRARACRLACPSDRCSNSFRE